MKAVGNPISQPEKETGRAMLSSVRVHRLSDNRETKVITGFGTETSFVLFQIIVTITCSSKDIFGVMN